MISAQFFLSFCNKIHYKVIYGISVCVSCLAYIIYQARRKSLHNRIHVERGTVYKQFLNQMSFNKQRTSIFKKIEIYSLQNTLSNSQELNFEHFSCIKHFLVFIQAIHINPKKVLIRFQCWHDTFSIQQSHLTSGMSSIDEIEKNNFKAFGPYYGGYGESGLRKHTRCGTLPSP